MLKCLQNLYSCKGLVERKGHRNKFFQRAIYNTQGCRELLRFSIFL